MALVFVSYCSTDRAAAVRLKGAIESWGHTVWLDTEQINVGDSIVGRINAGLTDMSYLLLCFSDAGLTSRWMDREWMSSLARQLNDGNVKILPVRLAKGSPPAVLADLRYADLVKDWDQGLHELHRALES